MGSVKICNPPMVEVTITKISVGFNMGNVMLKNRRNALAPSTNAASCTSRGMACMAARTIRAL